MKKQFLADLLTGMDAQVMSEWLTTVLIVELLWKSFGQWQKSEKKSGFKVIDVMIFLHCYASEHYSWPVYNQMVVMLIALLVVERSGNLF